MENVQKAILFYGILYDKNYNNKNLERLYCNNIDEEITPDSDLYDKIENKISFNSCSHYNDDSYYFVSACRIIAEFDHPNQMQKIENNSKWNSAIKRYCTKHKIPYKKPSWHLVVDSFLI